MPEPTMSDDYFFSPYADSWWSDDSKMNPLRSFNPERFAYFDRFLDDWKGKRVLDVGCGGGYTTEFLHQRGSRVCGVDPSAKLVAAATRHADDTDRDISYTVGKAEELPYPDRSFDAVTCVDVLEHVESPALAVREIHRVLDDGGIFLYDTINRTLRSRIMMIWLPERVLGIVPRGAHDHRDFITPDEMLGHLGAAGFVPLGRMAGISIRGQRKDGSLRLKPTRDLSSLYLGAARRLEGRG
ncbi:bifunctional 2-polyprenyl-6-hydroxyphenol methylase/3-demethylubiquinol 3-O-methyltransferase UbiG [Actinomadura sp. NEAU-AAG7]|uniref:bifunctional 2-polyprenyl-6-hydroxyphenol methylase/3-demethylubiquinol 3-O-methyltransferase UbiG n=1 Tax=Actinomadura sp. NEAU-AAG7 TaxID=2839640 RepID=UPI001BE47296|nr:bifunctional 2-polyprenyl-6-hydroxyphenol methylase/3-demethylubiquinol 3-O-methyltransferase UbiG [Actinomadura sp. NEAU-AAG7]MBT2212405.1 bifunctional 2-polyprenyl-6-hydroxyphenol methylase/3-demethylubiquinol 3-O-methyltransferase UbiG [Actinomadura sp. NEAU-AAG7]